MRAVHIAAVLAALLVFLAGGPAECRAQYTEGGLDAVVGEAYGNEAEGSLPPPQDNNNNDGGESLLEEEPTLTPLVELLEGGPAAIPPPPPDPAAVAAAEAAKEMGKKGDEKTDKKLSEEKRKHQKRQEWRNRQQKKLDDIKSEANTKIKKEADQKVEKKTEQKQFDAEIQDKKAQITAEVGAIKQEAMDKAAALKAKNEEAKKAMQAELASIKSETKEKDDKVIGKVRDAIAAQKAKADADQALTMAKITKAEDDEQTGIKQQFDDDIAALDKQFADARAARESEVAGKAAEKAKLKQKDDKYEQEMDARDTDFQAELAKLETKENDQKARSLERIKEDVKRAFTESPGAKKVERLKRRQDREIEQLGREVTRDSRRQMHRATTKMNEIAKDSKEAIENVLRSQLKALHKGAKDLQHADAPAAEHLVAQAWQFAVDGRAAPSRAQAEAVQVARGGSTDLVPGSEPLASTALKPSVRSAVEGAWRQAYGQHEPRAPPDAQNVSPQMRAAFAKALGVSDAEKTKREQAREAQHKVHQAWASAMGGNGRIPAGVSQQTEEQLAENVLGFSVSEQPLPADVGDSAGDSGGAQPPEDALEVALAARQVQPRPALKQFIGTTPQHLQQPLAMVSNPQASADQAVLRILEHEQQKRTRGYLHDVLLKRSHKARQHTHDDVKAKVRQLGVLVPSREIALHEHVGEATGEALAMVTTRDEQESQGSAYKHPDTPTRSSTVGKTASGPIAAMRESEPAAADFPPEVLIDESAATKTNSALQTALPVLLAVAAMSFAELL